MRSGLFAMILCGAAAGCGRPPQLRATRPAPVPSRDAGAAAEAPLADAAAPALGGPPACRLAHVRAVSADKKELGELREGLTIATRGASVGVGWSRKQNPKGESLGDVYDGVVPHLASWTGVDFAGLATAEVGVSSAAASSQQTAAVVVVNPRSEKTPFGAVVFAEWGVRAFGLETDFSGLTAASPRVMPANFAASTPAGGFVGASRDGGRARAVILADGVHTPWPSFEECYRRLEEGRGHPDCWRSAPATEAQLIVFPLVGAPRSARVAAPGAAAIALGETRGAFVARRDGELAVTTFGADGAAPSAPVAVRKGDVGAPALAFDGDAIWLAWAERASPAGKYHLVVARWPPGDGAPTISPIETGEDHAFAPAVAVRTGKVYLAWTEGELDTRGSIHATAWSAGGAPPPTARVASLTRPEDNARDPELSAGDATWIVWTGYTKAAPGGDVMAATLECP